MKKISNKFYQGASLTTISFLVIFAGIVLKLEETGLIVSSINSYPSCQFVRSKRQKETIRAAKYDLK